MTNKNIQLYFFLGLLLVIFLLNVLLFLPFLKLFAVVGIIAVIFHPLYLKLRKYVIHNDSFAAGGTIVVAFIIIIIPITFFSFQVVSEARNFYANFGVFSSTLSHVSMVITDKLSFLSPFVSVDISAHIKTLFEQFFGSVGSIFSGILNGLFVFLLGIVTLFFFLRDGQKFIQKLIIISPLAEVYDEEILSKLKHAVNSIVKGSLAVAGIQGVVAGIGLFIFGIPNPALWGALAMFAALIPGIGTGLVVIPVLVYLFVTGQTFNFIGFGIWGVMVVGLVDNFVRPILVGRGVHIHPFLIFMSVFGGIIVFGPLGFLLGPLVLSILYSLMDIYPIITKRVLK